MRWGHPQAVGCVHVDGLEGLVDAEDDGEPDRRLAAASMITKIANTWPS
jgi:hypothetical protein